MSSRNSSSAQGLTESVEMYLEVIFVLEEQGKTVRSKDVAADWGVSKSSATEMVRRLSDEGYVTHEPYRDIKLTARGREVGRIIVRRHRLLEILLERNVGMGHAEADSWACRMEHVIPPELEAWVCAFLGHPARTPSGDPVPPGPCCGRE